MSRIKSYNLALDTHRNGSLLTSPSIERYMFINRTNEEKYSLMT